MPELEKVKAKRKLRAKFAVSVGILNHVKEAQLLFKVPADSPTEHMSYIVEKVRSGEFTLLDVFEDGQRVGWTIYSIEENELGKEFLSVASYGKSNSGQDLSANIIPILEGLAKEKACKSIRLHTLRPGLVKKLSSPEIGWFLSEYVMRKEIA